MHAAAIVHYHDTTISQGPHFAPCPTQPYWLGYANDDHLIEKEIFRELADELRKGGEGSGEILEFEDGGHNVQKTRAREIAKGLLRWYAFHFSQLGRDGGAKL